MGIWVLFVLVAFGLNAVLGLFILYCIIRLGRKAWNWLVVFLAINSLPVLNLLSESAGKLVDIPLVVVMIFPLNLVLAGWLGVASHQFSPKVRSAILGTDEAENTTLSDYLDSGSTLALLEILIAEGKRVYEIEVIFGNEAISPEMSIYQDPEGSAAENIRQDCIPFVKEMAEKFGKSAVKFEIIYG